MLKFSWKIDPTLGNRSGWTAGRHIKEVAEASLKRLKTDRIDYVLPAPRRRHADRAVAEQ
jgi:aryl-alcohol dehydrogenase-like predicted oxidoreductase